MSDNNADLAMQEVDDELRRERINAIWKAYGKYVIGVAVAIILAVAGNEAFKSYQDSINEEKAAAFDAVLASTDGLAGAEALAAWQAGQASLDGAYAVLAQFAVAEAARGTEDAALAIATYDAIASTAGVDAFLAGLAQLRAALITLFELGERDAARSRLTVLVQTPSPFLFSAREHIALLDFQAGDLTKAFDAFALLATQEGVPSSLTERASTMRDIIANLLAQQKMSPVENKGEAQ